MQRTAAFGRAQTCGAAGAVATLAVRTRLVAGLLAAMTVAAPLAPASARTWHVVKDGSGDFTAIQPAINAAASGDVIEIGPGRYIENAPFSPQPGGWIESTYVGVTKENLTIRGTDRDAVIIGPTAPSFTTYGPKGIATLTAVQRLRIENLTVENVHDGMYLGPDDLVVVTGCLLRGCDIGIVGVDDVHPLIEQCEFVRCREGLILWTARDGLVRDCTFTDGSVGVTYLSSTNGLVSECRFQGGIGGTKHAESTGRVEGCIFSNRSNYAILATDNASIDATGNSCSGGSVGLWADFGGHIAGSGNLITGSTYAAVRFRVSSTCDLHFNDILPAAGYAVRAESYLREPFLLDLTNNYWGVETASEISALILDQNDDPTVNAVVDFEPFSIHSVPTTEQSFGELKARFGRRE